MSLFPLHAISVTESPLPSIVFSLLTFNELFSTSSFSLFKNPSFLEKNILCTLSWVNLLPKKLTICSLSNIWTMFYFFVVFDSDCDFFFWFQHNAFHESSHIWVWYGRRRRSIQSSWKGSLIRWSTLSFFINDLLWQRLCTSFVL